MELVIKADGYNARMLEKSMKALLQRVCNVLPELQKYEQKTSVRVRLAGDYADVQSYRGIENFKIIVRYSPPKENHQALRGRITALLGAFLLLSEHHIGTPDRPIQIDLEESTVTELPLVRKWGRWFLGELAKQYPDIPEYAAVVTATQTR